MIRIQIFKCQKTNEVFDKLMRSDDKTILCNCGAQASRLLSAPKYFGNTTGKSPATR
mgnify:CR=1 FL=1